MLGVGRRAHSDRTSLALGHAELDVNLTARDIPELQLMSSVIRLLV